MLITVYNMRICSYQQQKREEKIKRFFSTTLSIIYISGSYRLATMHSTADRTLDGKRIK